MIEGLEKIYTVPEVAEYPKLSKSKVYFMIQKGEILYIKSGKNAGIQ